MSPQYGIEVQSVSVSGVVLVRTSDRHPAHVTWEVLRSAATQDDPELRAAYRRALNDAEGIAYTRSPLVVRYGQASTNVWWVTWVETAWGGLCVGQRWRTMTIVAADEGGTQAHRWMAESEARDIAARIRKVAPEHDVCVAEVQS